MNYILDLIMEGRIAPSGKIHKTEQGGTDGNKKYYRTHRMILPVHYSPFSPTEYDYCLNAVLLALCHAVSTVLSSGIRLKLTKSRVQHVQGHLVAFLSTSDGHQTLVAALLWLVDLDDASTEMSDFVDLGSALSDDRANHVVGDVDLLSQWLAGHHAANRSCSRSAGLGGLGCSVRTGLVGTSTGIRGMGGSAIRHGRLVDRGRSRLAMEVGNTVGTRRSAVRMRVMSSEGLRMTVLAADRLGDIGHHLHTARDGSSRTSAAGSVGRSGWSAETLGELLDQGNGNIVGGNVDCIRNTEDHKGALRRQGKACI